MNCYDADHLGKWTAESVIIARVTSACIYHLRHETSLSWRMSFRSQGELEMRELQRDKTPVFPQWITWIPWEGGEHSSFHEYLKYLLEPLFYSTLSKIQVKVKYGRVEQLTWNIHKEEQRNHCNNFFFCVGFPPGRILWTAPFPCSRKIL